MVWKHRTVARGYRCLETDGFSETLLAGTAGAGIPKRIGEVAHRPADRRLEEGAVRRHFLPRHILGCPGEIDMGRAMGADRREGMLGEAAQAF